MAITELVASYPPPQHTFVRYGGGGAVTRLISGCLAFEQAATNPLLAALPHVVHIRGTETTIAGWIERTLQLLSDEAVWGYPGYAAALTRLSDLLFIQVVRAYMAQLQPAASAEVHHLSAGWLRGLADPLIGAALTKIHAEPAHAWTVGQIGRAVGLSRTAFAQRFGSLVGVSPMKYVTRWRMHKASVLLHDSTPSVADSAAEVGYAWVPAFQRAFKRYVGVSPAAYRDRAAHVAEFGVRQRPSGGPL